MRRRLAMGALVSPDIRVRMDMQVGMDIQIRPGVQAQAPSRLSR